MAPITGTATVVVVTGGDEPDATLVAALGLPPAADRLVVAADSGIAHAVALGLAIDVAVGDFDSVDPDLLASIEAQGVRVERHPVAKDATDLELAMDEAVALGARRIVVLGGHGGRLDHFLANALVLGADRYGRLEVSALVGAALVRVLRPGPDYCFVGRPGDLVTVLPVGGPAVGVRTRGLRFPLHGETLPVGTTRGVSNVLAEPDAAVGLDGGVALVIHPGPDRPGRSSTSSRSHREESV